MSDWKSVDCGSPSKKSKLMLIDKIDNTSRYMNRTYVKLQAFVYNIVPGKM